MNDEKANRIISEFMGTIFYHENGAKDVREDYHEQYTNSLDALIPVWEKLCLASFEYHIVLGGKYKAIAFVNGKNEYTYSKTIQQAAAYSTAKCIEEQHVHNKI